MRLARKVAIVTGGASGIGRAAAERFAREGAKIVVADSQASKAAETCESIRAAGGEAIAVGVDIPVWTQVAHMAETAIGQYGRIDVLFNGAGVLAYGTVVDTEEDCWNRVLSVNLTGTFLCCKAVLPFMIRQGGGSIINVSSTVGAHDACGRAAAYVASKAGVNLLTKCIAIDHAREGIRANVICPGPTDTPMLRQAMTAEQLEIFTQSFPMRRLGLPEELANAALFLASEESSFVTGLTMFVDGGQTAEV